MSGSFHLDRIIESLATISDIIYKRFHCMECNQCEPCGPSFMNALNTLREARVHAQQAPSANVDAKK
jgi:hypothetical protein